MKMHSSDHSVIGNYEIQREIGSGSMSIVSKAIHKKSKATFALKYLTHEMLQSDKKSWYYDGLHKEYKALRRFSHKNVIHAVDFFQNDDNYYLVLDYIDGTTLLSFLEDTAVSPKQKMEIVKGIASAIHHVHEKGYIHCDLKPENVLIRNNQQASLKNAVTLIDFGTCLKVLHPLQKLRWIKKKWASFRRKDIVVEGSFLYMSPEQTRGEDIDHLSDIYSFGALLYVIFTGRPLFITDADHHSLQKDGQFMTQEWEQNLKHDFYEEIAHKHQSETPIAPKEINAQIPDELNTLILRCVEKRPSKRYQNSYEIMSQLSRLEFIGNTWTIRRSRTRV